MTNPSNIERVVMRRVRGMRALKLVFSNTVLASLALALALWEVGREVWVTKVFANGPQDLLGHLAYLGYAFAHTHLAVQMLSLITIAALIVLARETARLIVATIQPHTYTTN